MNRVWPRLNSRPKRSVHVFTFPYLGEHADAQRAFSDFEFRRHNSVDASRRRADDPETLLNLIVCRMGQGLLVTPRRDRGCRASRHRLRIGDMATAARFRREQSPVLRKRARRLGRASFGRKGAPVGTPSTSWMIRSLSPRLNSSAVSNLS
jgi:hypothetical protein